jgi:hypothetical protein
MNWVSQAVSTGLFLVHRIMNYAGNQQNAVETTFITTVSLGQEQVGQFWARLLHERVTMHGLGLYEVVMLPLLHLSSDGDALGVVNPAFDLEFSV